MNRRAGDEVTYGKLKGRLNGVSPSGLAFVTFGDVTIPLKDLDGNREFPRELQCSFCGKTNDEVRKLISGRLGFICDECVSVCVGIVNQPNKDEQQNQSDTDKQPEPTP